MTEQLRSKLYQVYTNIISKCLFPQLWIHIKYEPVKPLSDDWGTLGSIYLHAGAVYANRSEVNIGGTTKFANNLAVDGGEKLSALPKNANYVPRERACTTLQ